MPDLHDRINDVFGEEPPHRPLEEHLANGHRAVRRRRLATGAGTLAVLAVVGGAAYAVQDTGGGDRRGDPVTTQAPTGTPDPETELVEQCHEKETKGSPASYLWRGGEPQVMASIDSWDGYTKAYLRSGNGKFWAECYVEDGHGTLMPAQRIAPDARVSNLGYGYGVGKACRPAREDCRRFVATHEGRRDPAVARIEVRFLDGRWERADTNEGYYYLEHVGTLPDDITWSKDELPLRNGESIDDVINRIKLFGADGELIAYWDASQNRNGINAPNGKEVAEIEDFPMIQSKLAGPEKDR